MHSTNYYETFIEVADDCPVHMAEVPLAKGQKETVATLQFGMISRNPYQFTSDDVLFETYARRKDLAESEKEAARALFFSKGQPCFRASPLSKRYGWGVHSNAEGKIALFAVESRDYEKLANDMSLKHLKAMRSQRA